MGRKWQSQFDVEMLADLAVSFQVCLKHSPNIFINGLLHVSTVSLQVLVQVSSVTTEKFVSALSGQHHVTTHSGRLLGSPVEGDANAQLDGIRLFYDVNNFPNRCFNVTIISCCGI